MKTVQFLSVATLLLGVAGCSTPPVVVAPVGPNPASAQSAAASGSLQVFSSVVEQYDDQNQASDGVPGWPQHTDYNIYDQHGKLVQHVVNETGHYAPRPKRIDLSAGRYLVKAQANDYFQVDVPVTIEPGRTTIVHLDKNWKPGEEASKQMLVTMPDGVPVGWRAE